MRIEKPLAVAFLVVILLGCSTSQKETTERLTWDDRGMNAVAKVEQGISARSETVMQYRRDGKPLLNIRLQELSVVGVATKPQKWGYFQFPKITRTMGGALSRT